MRCTTRKTDTSQWLWRRLQLGLRNATPRSQGAQPKGPAAKVSAGGNWARAIPSKMGSYPLVGQGLLPGGRGPGFQFCFILQAKSDVFICDVESPSPEMLAGKCIFFF